MTPAQLVAVASRTLATALGGIGVFEVYVAWLGVPGMALRAGVMLAAATGITVFNERRWGP